VAVCLAVLAGWFVGAAAGAVLQGLFGGPGALVVGAVLLVSLLTAHAHARGTRRIAHSRH
jgi:uncharacterized membrane protein YoaK (UPF0700 family)